jgi:hypothetical protein
VNGGALGTPSSGTLTNATGLPLTTGVTGTLPVANGGTGVTTSTGSGSVVLNNSPTLVTPALGTPSSGTLSNCTGYPVASLSGTLPVSGGGTGATTLSGVMYGNGTSAFTAATGSQIATAIGATAVTNATNATTATTATTATKLSTASGSAPSYSIRAWVVFDGTGSDGTNMTILASGNVSTVYRNSAGDYTITFSTAMPSAYYSVSGSVFWVPPAGSGLLGLASDTPTSSSFRIVTLTNGNDTPTAFSQTSVMVMC